MRMDGHEGVLDKIKLIPSLPTPSAVDPLYLNNNI